MGLFGAADIEKLLSLNKNCHTTFIGLRVEVFIVNFEASLQPLPTVESLPDLLGKGTPHTLDRGRSLSDRCGHPPRSSEMDPGRECDFETSRAPLSELSGRYALRHPWRAPSMPFQWRSHLAIKSAPPKEHGAVSRAEVPWAVDGSVELFWVSRQDL